MKEVVYVYTCKYYIYVEMLHKISKRKATMLYLQNIYVYVLW